MADGPQGGVRSTRGIAVVAGVVVVVVVLVLWLVLRGGGDDSDEPAALFEEHADDVGQVQPRGEPEGRDAADGRVERVEARAVAAEERAEDVEAGGEREGRVGHVDVFPVAAPRASAAR